MLSYMGEKETNNNNSISYEVMYTSPPSIYTFISNNNIKSVN